MFIAFRYRRLKMQIFFSLTNLANYLLNITHFCDHKNVWKLFYQNIFSSCYFWHRLTPLLKLWNGKIKTVVFEVFDPSLKKIHNGPLKFGNPSTTHKFYVDLGPKSYLGSREPIVGSMGYGVGSFLICIFFRCYLYWSSKPVASKHHFLWILGRRRNKNIMCEKLYTMISELPSILRF